MVAELQSLGIELMITWWPFQSRGSHWFPLFNSSKYLAVDLQGHLAEWEGGVYLVDQTNPAARAQAFASWWEGYGQFGVKGVWMDAAEVGV